MSYSIWLANVGFHDHIDKVVRGLLRLHRTYVAELCEMLKGRKYQIQSIPKLGPCPAIAVLAASPRAIGFKAKVSSSAIVMERGTKTAQRRLK